jgi:hypothetical protein
VIIALKVGQYITPTRILNSAAVAYWRYASECADIGGGLMPGAELRVVATSAQPGRRWVCAEIPGRYPTASLKISGEEYAGNFRLLR